MKTIISLILVSVLLLSGLGAIAGPEATIEYHSVQFSNLSVKETTEGLTVSVKGTNSMLLRENHYMVPMYTELFTFPFGTKINDVEVAPTSVKTKTISSEIQVTPQRAVVSTQGQPRIVEKSSTIKTIDTWYEFDVGTGIIDSERSTIVKVNIYPVQYLPDENILKWTENAEISISYTTTSQPENFGNQYNCIVIAPDEYEDELNSLVQHKNNNGITTLFVSLTDIYGGVHFPVQGRDNQEKIKYFIKNAIETWDIDFVLLVGSSNKLPIRLTHIFVEPDDDETFVSDLYYADIYNETGQFASWDTNENNVFGEYDWGTQSNYDEVDLHPDVYLGRLACSDGGQVTTVVNKIITYETDKAYTEHWFTDMIVVGGDSFTEDPQEADEGEIVNEAALDIMSGFLPTRMWASNGAITGLIPTGVEKLKNRINEGAGFIDFSGHGNTNIYATHPHLDEFTWLPSVGGFYASSVGELSNGDKLPIVVMGACSVSKFNENPNCFSWTFVKDNNGGSIATFGATALGYAYIGPSVIYGLVEKIGLDTFRGYRLDGAKTLGEMWSLALNRYISAGMDAGDYKTVEEWQLLGDPTLIVAEDSIQPAKPSPPDGPTDGRVNVEYTYTVETTDGDGDQIYYVFDWGDGTYSDWVGPYNSGVTAEASHSWSDEGEYEIRVIAKDDRGTLSYWSDPMPINMPVNVNTIDSLLYMFFQKLFERFPLLEALLSTISNLVNL